MSRQTIIPASENLIQEIVSRFPTDSSDFRDILVVFPGKRPAHFVRKALADRIKGSFIPPRIFSIDTFIDHLVAERLQIHRRMLEDFDAVALLFDIHRDLANPLGGDHFKTLDRFLSLGLKLYAELEELVMADVEPQRIREALVTVPLGRVQALPSYFDRFYEALKQKNIRSEEHTSELQSR